MICPQCGAYCRDEYEFCPTCGAALSEPKRADSHTGRQAQVQKKPVYKKVWFWLLMLVAFVWVSNVINSSHMPSVPQVSRQTQSPQQASASQGEEPVNSVPVGHQNALKTAKAYITMGGFSYAGLIDQLKYERYNDEECAYAVNNCGADWNEQALICAKRYVENMGFSAQGLKEQLLYEQFTGEQANYGVENCGADWNQEAAELAGNYILTMSFSRDGLIEQLEYEGFTHEQAVYGVQQNGY